MLYSAHINSGNEKSVDSREGFTDIGTATEWCKGWISAIKYVGLPFPDVFWWQIKDDEAPVYEWSEKDGEHWFTEQETDSVY